MTTQERQESQRSGALEFAATLVKVEPIAPKKREPAYYSNDRSTLVGGGLRLTLEIDRPSMPAQPREPYEARESNKPKPPKGERPGEFTDPEMRKGEKPDAYQERVEKERAAHRVRMEAWEEYDDDLEGWQEHRDEYLADLARYEQARDTLAQSFAAFAQLAGVGTLLNGLAVHVTLRPDQSAIESYLPGFSPALQLIAAPEPDGQGD